MIYLIRKTVGMDYAAQDKVVEKDGGSVNPETKAQRGSRLYAKLLLVHPLLGT